MKIIIEVISSKDFDYEYFIDWLNDELTNGNIKLILNDYLANASGFGANIVAINGKVRY